MESTIFFDPKLTIAFLMNKSTRSSHFTPVWGIPVTAEAAVDPSPHSLSPHSQRPRIAGLAPSSCTAGIASMENHDDSWYIYIYTDNIYGL